MLRIQTDPSPSALAAVDRQCFVPPWEAPVYADLCANPAVRAWLLRTEAGEAVGLLCFQSVGDEAEVYRIGVVPGARGQGWGRHLLASLQGGDGPAGLRRIHLEVRAGNEAARALYARTGFREVATRRAYYRDPTEDAVLYAWEADDAAAAPAGEQA